MGGTEGCGFSRMLKTIRRNLRPPGPQVVSSRYGSRCFQHVSRMVSGARPNISATSSTE